jgi:hypothetical protein
MRLSDLYGRLNAAQRAKLASDADLDPGYLWQIATRWRGKRPSIELMARLAKADKRLKLADMVAEFSAMKSEAA